MKNKLIFIFFLLFTISGFAQETKYKEYSYTELFNMIEEEKDSIFELKNAWIKFDSITDMAHSFRTQTLSRSSELIFQRTDTIFITKELLFENVLFDRDPRSSKLNIEAFHHINFKNKVRFTNCLGKLFNSTFQEEARFYIDDDLYAMYNNTLGRRFNLALSIKSNEFKNGFRFNSVSEVATEALWFQLMVKNNIIWPSKEYRTPYIGLFPDFCGNIDFNENTLKGKGEFRVYANVIRRMELNDNDFGNFNVEINLANREPISNFEFSNNQFLNPLLLSLTHLNQENLIDWEQFKNGVIEIGTYFSFLFDEIPSSNSRVETENRRNSKETYDYYYNNYRYENKAGYKKETKFLGKFYAHYKNQHDTENANLVYMQLKNLETNHLGYLYKTNPSFKTYFKWKVNQFLKVFSDYGTEPSKAIVFSVYVVFFFALIYLFFPNSWDKHGKNRIVDRYNFFFKYMKRKAGIHEVYLEEQNDELMSYDQFKENISTSKQKVPKFFTATALPLYKWAISGTKLSASILKRVDIMKGSWQELPKSKRIWKSILLIGAFTIAVVYDIFIKMLNALMLSINTFTTLGFGEIPIKGLPRYLAIIQGFIGWFMLTIFSVSLISQLLN